MDIVAVERIGEEDSCVSLAGSSFTVGKAKLRRSPVLSAIVERMNVGARESVEVPSGYTDAWLRFLEDHISCSRTADATLLILVKAADFFADQVAADSACTALSKRVHEALTKQVPKKKRQPPKQNIARKSNRSRASGKGETPQPVDLTEEGEEEDAAPVLDVEQVLQLPGHLSASIVKQSGVKLDTFLTRLPARLHASALSCLIPEVTTHKRLHLDSSFSLWTPLDPTKRKPKAQAYEATSALLIKLLAAVSAFPALSEMSLKLQMKIESAKAGTGIGKSKQASVPLEQQFSETLSSLSELKVLSLRDTFAEAHMLRAVASMVPQLEKLTRLEIHAVPVHPWLVDIQCSVPAEELREALKKCVWLKDLVLRGVGTVGDTMPRVACELMTSITHITSLESLQLVEGTLSGLALKDFEELPANSDVLSCMPNMHHLTIGNCDLQHMGPTTFTSFFRLFPHLHKLKLYQTPISTETCKEGAKVLAEALSWNASELKQLRVLEISSCLSMPIREDLYSGMEDHLSLLHTPYAGSIADACLKLNIVEELTLDGPFEEDCFQKMCVFISQSPQLRVIGIPAYDPQLESDFRSSEDALNQVPPIVSSQVIDELSSALIKLSCLEYLDVSGHKVCTPAAPPLIASLLPHHATLWHLNLQVAEGDAPYSPGVSVSGLSELTNLTFLGLPRPGQDASLREIASALQHLSCLKELSAVGGRFGSCREALLVLSELVNLTRLNLSESGMTLSNFPVLTQSLGSLELLQYFMQKLNLSNNKLGSRVNSSSPEPSVNEEDEPLELPEVLGSLKHLRSVEIRHCRVDWEDAGGLVSELGELTGMTKLDLRGNLEDHLDLPFDYDNEDELIGVNEEWDSYFDKEWIWIGNCPVQRVQGRWR